MGALNVDLPDGTRFRLLAENQGAIEAILLPGGGGAGGEWQYGFLTGGTAGSGANGVNTWGSWFGPPPLVQTTNPGAQILVNSGQISVAVAMTIEIVTQISSKVGAPGVAPFELEYVWDFNGLLINTTNPSDFSSEWEQTVNDQFGAVSLVQVVTLVPGDNMALITRCHNDNALITIDKWQFSVKQLA